jgi:hypothetical protein
VFGLVFAITDSLARLGGGLAVLFGLASMVLAMQLTRPFTAPPAGPDLDIVLPVAAAAAVVGLLFVLGRRPRPSAAPEGPDGAEGPDEPIGPEEPASTATPVTIDQG